VADILFLLCDVYVLPLLKKIPRYYHSTKYQGILRR